MLTKADAIKVAASAVAVSLGLLMILSWSLDLFPSASVEVRFMKVESEMDYGGMSPEYFGRKLIG